MLQKAGGLFQLLAEVDFGTTYGLKSTYYKSRSADIADAGFLRLARTDVIAFRNSANDGNLNLAVNSADLLTFDGAPVLLGFLPSGQIYVGNSNGDAQARAMSGDATLDDTGALTIADDAVSNAKLAEMATLTLKGNSTGGSANPSDLSVATVTSMLNAFVGDSGSGGVKGLVPAPAAGDAAANKFLSASGIWTVPPGSGDVVGPASSTDNGFVRFDGTTGKLIKNSAATISNADVNASAAIAYSKLNLSGSIVNADVASGAAIAVSKLAALTASRAVVTDGSGVVSAATTTATEIGYVNGVTSAIQTQINTNTPTGSVIMFGGASAPTGWLLCDGSAVSRTTYSALFAILSTTYGVGDGSTTFNLPNTQGVFVRGAGSQTISTIGYTGTRGTTQGDQMQGHRHALSVPQQPYAVSNAGPYGYGSGANAVFNDSGANTVVNPTTDTVNGTPRTGSETRPANIVLNYIIKT